MKENTVMNPIHLTVKQWYNYLLEKFVTTREIDQEGRRELIPNRIEELSPNVQWAESYRLARLNGSSQQTVCCVGVTVGMLKHTFTVSSPVVRTRMQHQPCYDVLSHMMKAHSREVTVTTDQSR